MVILTNTAGNEIRTLDFKKVDIDLNDTKDFELTVEASADISDIEYGCRIFVPGTEFGGIIGKKNSETSENVIVFKGNTWRGVLQGKVIEPPEGASHKKVSGELNSILRGLIDECGLSGLFYIPKSSTGVEISYQFDRYISLLRGLEKMLEGYSYRLQLTYLQGERGEPGRIEIKAVPVEDLSSTIELSQDSRLDFSFEEVKDNPNHLICLGQGELEQREVVHLYADEEGNITTTQSLFGIQERTAVYENTATEDLMSDGIAHFKELLVCQRLNMEVESLGIDVGIGDIVGGRDYITGMYMKQPVTNKIYAEETGTVKIDYKVGKIGSAASSSSSAGASTPDSSGGGDKHYIHSQETATDMWEVVHNLGKFPAVSVVDSAGTEVEGDVEHLDTNRVRLCFSAAFSGKAYFN